STDNKVEKNTNAIVKFKDNVDVPITVMFAPSTGYIADDVLPTVHDEYNDDTYFESASKTFENNGIAFVDLRETFKDAYSNGSQLYYKTDHHWTTEGAYTAYAQLCKNLATEPVAKESLSVEKYDGFYGTTYSTSGFWLTDPDTVEVWNNPANTDNIKVKITEGTEVSEYDSMYFYDHIDEDDKYPVFIDGNHALTEITNSNAKGGTLLMIKDSFSHSIAPFLAENYSKVILVDMRYYKQSVSDIVAQENPEQILVMYGIDNFATDTDIVWLK
ncbi:MAG: DHHW family protein, partial [Ruminococcus sp.]|nr:DHHW family protein [Ruminococcus sp.]